jgi:hypothetical protein
MSIPSITFMCPSRERAYLVQNSIESVLRSTGEDYVNEFLIAIDMDDSQMDIYESLAKEYNCPKLKVELFVCPSWGYRRLNNYYNVLADQARAPRLWLWNDDAEMLTHNFNHEIDKTPVNHYIYTVDPENPVLNQNKTITCTLPITPKKWTEIIGFYSDLHENDVFTAHLAEKTMLYSKANVFYRHAVIRQDLRNQNETTAINSMQSLLHVDYDVTKFDTWADRILKYYNSTGLKTISPAN